MRPGNSPCHVKPKLNNSKLTIRTRGKDYLTQGAMGEVAIIAIRHFVVSHTLWKGPPGLPSQASEDVRCSRRSLALGVAWRGGLFSPGLLSLAFASSARRGQLRAGAAATFLFSFFPVRQDKRIPCIFRLRRVVRKTVHGIEKVVQRRHHT